MEQNQSILSFEERDTYDLFKDKNISALFEQIPDDVKQEYKKQGQYMYDKDYEAAGNDLEYKLAESAAYINEGMKSGLRPSQLSKDEIEVMRTVYGNEWYKKYLFESEQD